jgi:hypothetical protein
MPLEHLSVSQAALLIGLIALAIMGLYLHRVAERDKLRKVNRALGSSHFFRNVTDKHYRAGKL